MWKQSNSRPPNKSYHKVHLLFIFKANVKDIVIECLDDEVMGNQGDRDLDLDLARISRYNTFYSESLSMYIH